MLLTGSAQIDAERAFARAAWRRRLAAALRRLRGHGADAAHLDVVAARCAVATRGVREIPLDSICATLEPSRAAQFDRDFRPAPVARTRWLRVWLAEARGAVLPPISVVGVADGFAVSDGHHRVSVAKARGAATIDAHVEGTL
jgi:hypothetical protein